MTSLLAWLTLAIGTAASVVLAIASQRRSESTWRRDLVGLGVRFRRGLEAKAVSEFLTGLSGIVAPQDGRPPVRRVVVLEVLAGAEGIEHRLLAPRSLIPIVLAQLRAAIPDAAVTELPHLEIPVPTLAGELGISHRARPLRTNDPVAVAHSILSSLQPLRRPECVVTQWTLRPLGPVAPSSPPSGSGWSSVLQVIGGGQVSPDAEALKAARAKYSVAVFQATVRLGVIADTHARAAELLHRLTAAFHAANAPGVHLYRRAIPGSWSGRRLVRRALPFGGFPCLVNVRELAGLSAFPLGSPGLPGLELSGARQLPPPAGLPSAGRVLAVSNYPGEERPLAMTHADALMHLHVMGPTGTGKSTLLLNMVLQDIRAGHGVVVIDPKGDLVADVLDRIPSGRIEDVVVLDPLDEERAVGLNLLGVTDDGPELVVERLVGLFRQLYKAFWGPRTDDVLRAACLSLLHEPGMTLAEVPLLLTDAGFRRRVVGRVDDPIALEPFWGWYEGLSDAERAAAIGPVMNKIRAFLLRRRVRNVVGQAAPLLDIDQALAERRVLLVPLPKGLLGEDASSLLGSLVVARVWQAVQHRAAISSGRRPWTFATIDEAQDFVHLPTSLSDVLAQARGLGLGLTLAHQHLAQLTGDFKSAVLANVRARVLFALRPTDARVMSREVGPLVDAQDLEGLGLHEVVVGLIAHGRVVSPATGITLPPPPSLGTADLVRARSRERYGRPREDVERELMRRHGQRSGEGPVGRVRRGP